jgi:hypothetical protein
VHKGCGRYVVGYSNHEIANELDIYGTFDNDELRAYVSTALAYLPEDTVDTVLEHCRFYSPAIGENGRYIPLNALEGRHLIIISRRTFSRYKSKTIFAIILHEVGHFILGHTDLYSPATLEEVLEQEESVNGGFPRCASTI